MGLLNPFVQISRRERLAVPVIYAVYVLLCRQGHTFLATLSLLKGPEL